MHILVTMCDKCQIFRADHITGPTARVPSCGHAMTRAWKEVPDDATKFPIYHFPGEVEELEIKFWPLTKRQTIMRALQRAQGETVELACDDVFALL